MWRVEHGDCTELMRALPEGSVDAIVCDPPYGLRFMGKHWDDAGDGLAQQEWHRQWLVEAERVLRPSGRLLAFGGTRTFHRLALAVSAAGLTADGLLAWCYGSGFPKSHNIGKALDKEAGAEREVVGQKLHARKGVAIAEERTAVGAGSFGEPRLGDVTLPATEEAKAWDGWGTALKPAWEPVVVARKGDAAELTGVPFLYCAKANSRERNLGLEAFAEQTVGRSNAAQNGTFEEGQDLGLNQPIVTRNPHPTVKPIEVMRWLIREVTVEGEVVLDPFTGSGTTGCAAVLEQREFIGFEREAEYVELARARVAYWAAQPTQLSLLG